jgi:hypothetical protein
MLGIMPVIPVNAITVVSGWRSARDRLAPHATGCPTHPKYAKYCVWHTTPGLTWAGACLMLLLIMAWSMAPG